MKAKPVLRNRTLFFFDLILTAASVLGSYALRFELGIQFYDYLPSALWMIGAALVIKPLVYYFFGLYRRIWSYASVNELKLIVEAVTTASVFTSMAVVIMAALKAFTGVPRGVLVLDWLLSILLIGGSKFILRMLSESFRKQCKWVEIGLAQTGFDHWCG